MQRKQGQNLKFACTHTTHALARAIAEGVLIPPPPTFVQRHITPLHYCSTDQQRVQRFLCTSLKLFLTGRIKSGMLCFSPYYMYQLITLDKSAFLFPIIGAIEFFAWTSCGIRFPCKTGKERLHVIKAMGLILFYGNGKLTQKGDLFDVFS